MSRSIGAGPSHRDCDDNTNIATFGKLSSKNLRGKNVHTKRDEYLYV